MAASNGVTIRVLGLREVSMALKAVGEEAPAMMKNGLRGIMESIATKIRGKFPRLSGRAAGSVKAQSSARGGAVSFGGSAAPYAPWLDFGGSVGRGHQSGPGMGAIHRDWMGKPGTGRYVFPTISEEHATTNQEVERIVIEVARANGFKVR